MQFTPWVAFGWALGALWVGFACPLPLVPDKPLDLVLWDARVGAELTDGDQTRLGLVPGIDTDAFQCFHSRKIARLLKLANPASLNFRCLLWPFSPFCFLWALLGIFCPFPPFYALYIPLHPFGPFYATGRLAPIFWGPYLQCSLQ